MRNINDEIRSKLWIHFYWHLGDIDSHLYGQLNSPLYRELTSQLWEQFRIRLRSQLKNNI